MRATVGTAPSTAFSVTVTQAPPAMLRATSLGTIGVVTKITCPIACRTVVRVYMRAREARRLGLLSRTTTSHARVLLAHASQSITHAGSVKVRVTFTNRVIRKLIGSGARLIDYTTTHGSTGGSVTQKHVITVR